MSTEKTLSNARGGTAKATPFALSLVFHGGLLVLLGGAALVPVYVQKPDMVAQIVQTAPVSEAPPEAAFEEPAAGSPTETAEAGGEASLESDLPPVAVDVVTSVNTAVPSAWFSQPGATELRGVASMGGGGQTGGGRGVPVGKGRGTVTLFGSSEAVGGELVGRFYDFKQNRKKEKTSNTPGNYNAEVKAFIDSGFDPRFLGKYYMASLPLYLTQLFIPNMPADQAPQAFAVQNEVQPSQWLVHYTGTVRSPVGGRIRFLGYADDVLVVAVDGRVVLNGSHEHSQSVAVWTREETSMKIASWDAYAGNWIDVTVGQNMQMDILVGERPGGSFSARLYVQEQSGKYEKTADGRLILPLFRTNGDKLPKGSPLEPHVGSGFSPTGPVFKGN